MSAAVASSLPVPGPGAAAPEQDGSSSNGGAADVEAASQGKVKGIIVPPPEIRAIADKTARFVAKNGKSFEQRILNSEEGRSAKFNFMRPHDPYYAYYEYKIREVEEGRDTPAGAPAAPAPAAAAPAAAAADGEAKEPGKATAAAAVQKKAVMAPIAKAARTIAKDVKPPPFVFSHGHPTGLTAHDLDLIKLTAQYTAAGGRQFLATLARKEAQNEMFQFLKGMHALFSYFASPEACCFLKGTHALFSYFTSLVDAYTKVLQPTEQQKAAAKAGCSRQVMLERAVHRWEYDRAEQEKRRAQEAEMDADKLAFRSIDWQDFVVVETIDFPEDELTGVTYGTMDEEQDVEMDMKEQDFVVVETIDFPEDELTGVTYGTMDED
ncbi:Surp module-domain-containing protein [Tribonema minus]|uniref:Surp module-domain-containing protein n=1 Tax=Tribonema minus TaxID=303371 RepID=A0A836C863_9STRA|nr:Surp module-domain-containing protein [Tribonema minus]